MSAILIKYFFILLWTVQLDCEVYKDRPRIKSKDGNLIIQPAVDKNIYLNPNGEQSGIFIGQVNLLNALFTNTSLDRQLNNDYQSIVSAPDPYQILRRLERLESLTSRLQDNLTDIASLSRRVSRLSHRITTLQTLINSRKRDECESQQCQHGGTCLNLVNGYHCLCPPNWEGKNCDTDVNECRNFAGTDLGCQNGATCINRPGSYECLCRNGWFGLHCTRKAKDCQEGDFEMCGHGTCIKTETGEGIKCICNQGWTTNGTGVACLTDVNECDTSLGSRCSINPKVDCINLPGSFRCGPCPSGYDGNGFVCYDVDECVTMPNGGCSTSPMVSCHNTIGSRICGSCPPGYEGDGVICTWRGSCFINHGGCHPSARCFDTASFGQLPTAQCICPAGMIGDGVGIHGCYIPSYTNDTQRCEGNPCGPNGQCHPLRTGYTCICLKGYSGARCDNNVNICSSSPCLNGGSCRLDSGSERGFKCICTALYSGFFCEVSSKPCGGVLDADEGSIVYPTTNSSYDHNSRCAWVIHTTPDKVINVTFSKFNLEDDSDCQYDFLQIHDGRSSASQLIGRFCGSVYPKGGNILSSHNNLYFWFRSDRTIAKDGFALHWTSIKPFCGGEIDASTHGHISSPGSPGKYPPNRDCYWHLSTSLGKRIQLHFFSLDIEVHQNCSFDYLAIYDGEHTTDPLLDKFCNSTQPAPIQSAGSEVLIHFHSDAFNSGYGFQIAFAPVDGVPGCGGYFTAITGEIVSPSYNGQYFNNLFCEYKIKTDPDNRIHIEFKSFRLESSRICKHDYLKVYDGSSSDSPLVGKYCGTNIPKCYTSSSNTLFLQFRTDNSRTSDGFKITYERICHITLIGDSGIIKSPGYPFSYPSDKMCEYVLRTRPGRSIVLTFQDFDIESSYGHANCFYDYVEIRDGLDRNATLLGKFCGGLERLPPVQTSSFNYMYILFNSDRSISGTGFYANYTTIDIKCGGIYKETSGVISHPREGELYSDDENCTWLLIAPEGMNILLEWATFDVESMMSCSNDYVQLIEIDENMTNTTIGKYCGTSLPPAVTIISNRVMIKFISDISITKPGFSLSYKFLDGNLHCSGTFVKPHGYLYSPRWPQSYEPNRDCNWTITVPTGQQILLNITDFDLERPLHDSCDIGDYLEIRNGASNTAPLIGKYCGNFKQKQILSTANSIYLHFHSDFYLTGKGFKIEWDGSLIGCGGTITGNSGSISSPNYPYDYDENSECFYKIVTSSASRIRIKFSDLELERTENCGDDYVEIFDGRDTTSSSFGKFCFLTPVLHNIETTSNFAFIKFRSDFMIKAKGFLLTYETICNVNISGAYGVIESPGYPNKYPTNSNCLWTISVPKGSKINITFTQFDILRNYAPRYRLRNFDTPWLGSIYSTNGLWSRNSFIGSRFSRDDCETDYLSIKETSDTNFTKKICGSITPPPIYSKTNSLQIKFVSGSYFTRTGFRLEWVRHGCGGIIQKSYGTLRLDESAILPEEMECEWIIETSPGTSIKLKITKLVIISSINCSIDALEIYNGQSASSPLLTKICHTGLSEISTTGNFMFLRFIKNSSHRDIKFVSQFSSSTAECGGTFKSRSGVVYSKNFPKNYDNNLDCIWFISVPIKHRIEFNIITLNLYKSNDDNRIDCGDMIKIYDGGRLTTSNYTYVICPTDVNVTKIITKSNKLALQFITDDYGTATGFKANFTMTCGAVIEALEDGFIKNDKYNSYLTNNCTWTILAPTLEDKIKLTITHMSIPQNIISNRRCSSSFLKVFDGNDDSAPLIGEYCGRTIPPMLVSHGSAMTIQLGSHTNMIDGYFVAYYTSLTNACGGTLTSEEGDIASPNYPLSYPLNADCEWILKTSPGNQVYITFENFDLEYSDGCNEDYLELRESHGGGKLLGLYCGNNVPLNTTVAKELYIKFHSDSKNVGQGFIAHYGFLHGNDITDLEAGVIASPLYPHPYEGSGEYIWRIITSGNGIISISIDHLEIHQHGDSCNSYLVFHDGYDDDAPVLDKVCGVLKGELQAKNLRTTSNVAYIKLVLDMTNVGSLFHLQWTKSNRGIDNMKPNNLINCGSNITELISPGDSITFHSPNYPEDYGNELNCEWVFKSLPDRHLRLFFDEISLEYTPQCYADYISMYSSNNLIQWTPLKEHICSSEYIRNYTDSTTYLKVTFNTDVSITRKGFQGRVKSMCGGTTIGKSGSISLTWLDIKQSTDRIKRCEWTIKVRPGRNTIVKFDHFNISNSENECTTYIVLRNGESTEAPILGKYCGYAHENRNEIISSGNAVHVTYVSTYFQPQTFQNFRLHYEEKNVECGGTSTLNSFHSWELISSPNYPSVPIPYTECIWVFAAPPGNILRVDFIDRFDLQTDKTCSLEYVEVKDGSSEISPFSKRFCKDRPGTIKTSNNYLYLRYVTQIAEPRDGFKANISINLCGGTIIANSGVITSPSYPGIHLPFGTICKWHVISTPRHVIKLEFKDLNLPPSETSCDTSVMIKEPIPGNKTEIILETLCDDFTDVDDTSRYLETFTNEVIIELKIGKPSEYFQISEHRGFKFTFNSSRPSCGGIITTSEGFLSTPGYPRKTTLRYCQWVIKVPDKNRRIRLELIDIDVDNQRLSFYDDNFKTVIQSISGHNVPQIPKIIESTGNQMAFHLFVKHQNTLHRLKAKFSSNEEALCGGTLEGNSGQLESPDLQRSYACEWEYNGKDVALYNNSLQNKSIYINVRINSSLTKTSCRFAHSVLNIRANVDKGEIKFLRNLCVNNTNVSYRLPSTNVIIKAHITSNFNFNLNWHLQPCGGLVRVGPDTKNIINVPNNYNDSLDCGWILVIPSGNRVEIKVEGSFSLDCTDEYLQISQGLDQFSTTIGDYCRDKMPENSLSTSFTYTHIQYHSKPQNSIKLKVMVRTVNDQCGGFLTMHDHVFASPNYPKGYSNNLECSWEIQADLGYRVSLQFLDRFAIQSSANCSKDALIIYDWKENIYSEIARICDRHLPNVFNSTSNKMKVVLRTDDSITLDGFKVQWNAICGGKFRATEIEQYIYSPGYPYEYGPSLNCIYEIFGSSQDVVVKFDDFELEGTFPNCLFDNLTVTGQGKDIAVVQETYCGKETPKLSKSFYDVKLVFKSDTYTQRKGFKISYSTFTCGGNITHPSLITSGGLDSYENNMNCTWIIEAPINKVVVFKFLYMALENYGECYNDYLGVFEGQVIDLSKRIALLCGNFNSTTSIKSNSNKALLQFISDSSQNYRGFKVEVFFTFSVAVGCGGIIHLSSGNSQIIKSPLIGTNVVYENNLDCYWEVKAPVDYVIRVEFESFHIAPCENVNQTALGFSNCDCDVLELRDGLNPNSLVIGSYCGHTKPPPLVSSRNYLSIRLSTDGDVSSSGFKALLTTQKSLCGKSTISVNHQVQRWTSPGYDSESIPRGLHCTYDLDTTSEPYSTVQITVHYLDLAGITRDTHKCDKDKLVIVGHSKPHNLTHGPDLVIGEYRSDFFLHSYSYEDTMNFPTRFELCGSARSIDYYVQGSISINLLTSPDNTITNHKGVEIEVMYLGFCGRNYTGTQGRIQFAYDTSMKGNERRDCYTLITAPENHTISAYFIKVLPAYQNDNAFLEIFDGNNTNSKLMLKISNEYIDSPLFSSGRYLLFHNRAHGFSMISYDLNFVTTDRGRGCGGIINNEVGRITSPLYPEIYRQVSTCKWEIQTPVGTRVMLRFTTFDLGRLCEQNYVELQDRNGNTLTKYCEETPADNISEDNFIRILFVTTKNNGGTGWVADFIGIV